MVISNLSILLKTTEKFDGSTFMEIQELVTDAVDCAFKPENITTKTINETSNRSRA